MDRPRFVSWRFGGASLNKAFQHFIRSLSGEGFRTPFARLPLEGLCPPTINVLCSLLNLVVCSALVYHARDLNLRSMQDDIALAFGIPSTCLFAAVNFSRFHGGRMRERS